MAWVGKLFLYLVTMIGTIGLTYCMMDFKLKRYKQILIFAAASLICIVGDFFVSNLQTKNADLEEENRLLLIKVKELESYK